MKTNLELIQTLAASPTFKDYERAFNEATGLPLALTAAETFQLPLHGRKRESAFCALIASSSGTCAGCLQSRAELAKAAESCPGVASCRYGLQEAAVPIVLGGRTIGFLHTGQVLPKAPTAAKVHEAASAAKVAGAQAGLEELKTAYLSTQVMSPKKLLSVAQILSSFASHLSLISNQILVQQENSEPAVITRAKDYIRAHQGEEISLADVANAVHTSTFYFCKIFKRFTGLNFTEFVSRSRIERAKELLLKPHMRVSEVAFEVGFQSLTHFNRVFKRMLGQSPSEYRAHLPHA